MIEFLPNGYFINHYINCDENIYIFLISNNKIILNENNINKFVNVSIAHIELYIDENKLHINYIKTSKNFKNLGIASFLILYSAYYFKNNNMQFICLDDMSDNAFSCKNIYKSLGFKYILSDEPEMICKIDNLKKSYFIEKYLKRDFFT